MSVADLLVVAVAIFAFCLAALIVIYAGNSLVGSQIDNSFFQTGLNVVNSLDKIAVMAAILFHLGILITAFMFPTHPAFMPLAIILLCIEVFITGNFFSALTQIANNPAIAAVSSPASGGLLTLMDLMPKITLAFGLLLCIVQYGRTEGGGVR